MLTFTLKSDSWHYWIANFAERRVTTSGSDICSYTRAFIAGMIWFLIVAFLSTTLSIWALVSIVDIGNWLIFGGYLPPYSQVFGLVVVAMAGILGTVAGIMYTKDQIHERSLRNIEANRDKPPSFVKLAYRKFKDKTCFKINFQ